ncbi:SpoIIE family protein phosphatase [Geodermatophilus sp. YIM 151500]|uniref:SpoIIE family protein phosphatase n=1 Tax=Geodermatophilus sp. YIM 151500 TaxID=2984531 RepID=UPI0021E4EFB5|nr:SpoIIE family protein phosphatase [Geodermatophilus sp. YIM 151500]MCV2490594.1 SpoIIE family protein phosphatase [Geodermatophilus sp. YIM 151500]
MRSPERGSRRADIPTAGSLWVLLALVTVAYAAGSAIAFLLFQASSMGAVFFAPAGVSLSALLLTRRRRWPWVLATVAAVEAGMDLLHGLPAASVPGFVLANTLEPLAGALLLGRVAGEIDLRRRRDLGWFITCGVLAAPLLGAVVGATTNAVTLGRDWWDAFFPFWAGDGLGVLTVAGTVLSWRVALARRELPPPTRCGLLVGSTAAVTVVGFWPASVPLAYLPMPLLFAVAFGSGVPLVTVSGLAMTLTANVMTAAGRGPWAALAGRPNLELATLQLFLAVAVLSAWLLAVEIGERQRARRESRHEAAARRAAEALQEVTAGLATAATSEAIAEVVVRRGIALVADDGAVGVLTSDPATLRTWTTSRGGADEARGEVPLAAPALLARAARTGRTIAMRAGEEGPDRSGPGVDPRPRSVLAVPVRNGPVVMGALEFRFDAVDALDAEVTALAEGLAELVGRALPRARLYEEEREAAHQLQRAFLPEVPDRLPGVAIGGCYRPADQQHDVGGDWYDVFVLPGGRVGFVVGDVVGHDLAAAAAMGRLHAALRVLAAGPHDTPGAVLSSLDRASNDIRGATFATIGYGEYEPATGELRYACAGHPPPLLVSGGRAEFLPAGRSLPLAMAEGPRPDARLVVPPEALLVWYSDGLVERRGSDLDDGLDRLARIATDLEGVGAQEACDRLLAAMTGGRLLDDDVVVLCLRLSGPDDVGATADAGAADAQAGLRLLP